MSPFSYMGRIVLDAAWWMSAASILAPELVEACAWQTSQLTKRFVCDGGYATNDGEDDAGGDQALEARVDLPLVQVGHVDVSPVAELSLRSIGWMERGWC